MEPGKRKKIVLVAGICLFLGLVALLVMVLPGSRNVSVEVAAVPSDAVLTVDGQPAKLGKLSLKPGKHTLKATRQYFAEAVKEIDTRTLQPKEVVYLLLGANTPEAQILLLSREADQMLYEKAIGAEFSKTQAQLLKDYPFIQDLPYRTLDFKIDYAVNDKQQVSLKVELYPVATTPGTTEYKQQLEQFKKRALDYIKSQKIDTSRITVTFSPDPNKL